MSCTETKDFKGNYAICCKVFILNSTTEQVSCFNFLEYKFLVKLTMARTIIYVGIKEHVG